jgi:hypothetical protein
MLFTSPRTGRAIADELRRQYNPSSTRRKGAPSSGEQTERSPTAHTPMDVWRYRTSGLVPIMGVVGLRLIVDQMLLDLSRW